MGKTIVKVKLINNHDLADFKRGFMKSSEVRSLEVEGIIDTGATMMSLPRKLVDALGLDITGTKKVRFGDGRETVQDVAGGLKVEIQGRDAETNCLVQDNTAPVLIGQVPLEIMDWAVHPGTQQLVPGHEGVEGGLIEMY